MYGAGKRKESANTRGVLADPKTRPIYQQWFKIQQIYLDRVKPDSLAEFSPISVTNMFIKSFLGKKGPRKGLRASTQPQGCLLK